MALSTIGTNSIADSAVTAVKTSGVGISEADMWRVSASFANSSNGSNEILTSNWERADTDFDKIGTGLSESSGVFTFPSTGVYLVQVNAYFYPTGANSDIRIQIRVTANNSDYNTRAEVINVSNVKFRIHTVGTTASNFWRGASDTQKFGFTSVRLGDT
jgi:hypothetical protein